MDGVDAAGGRLYAVARRCIAQGAFVLTLLCACATLASAQSRASFDAGSHGTRWYGYQLIAGDLVALAMTGFAMQPRSVTRCVECSGVRDRSGLAVAGAAGLYAIAGPAIHLGHRRWDKSVLSLGMRAAPWLIGMNLESAELRRDVIVFGSILASLLDWAFIARESSGSESAVRPSPRFRLALRGKSLLARVRF